MGLESPSKGRQSHQPLLTSQVGISSPSGFPWWDGGNLASGRYLQGPNNRWITETALSERKIICF